MKRSLVALILGSVLIGCGEKPKPQVRFFIDPMTGKFAQNETFAVKKTTEKSSIKEELTRKSPTKKELAENSRIYRSKVREITNVHYTEEVEKEEIFKKVTINGQKYEISFGSFEIDRSKYKGIIWESEKRKYGIVKTTATYVNLGGANISYALVPPGKNLPSTETEDTRWIETIPRNISEIKLGNESYWIARSNSMVCDSAEKKILETLPFRLINKETIIRLDDGRTLADFYFPIKIFQKK